MKGGARRSKFSPEEMAEAIKYRKGGNTYKKTTEFFLERFGKTVSISTIRDWVKKEEEKKK